jgi:hypothetical protein
LAQPVISDDYDWFTPADLTRVINAIHALPDWRSVVLVGGQSLTAWVEYYKIKLPVFEGPYLTIDADFLGTKAEAEVIARELGSKAQIPNIDDHTPNAAAIDFTGASGKKLHVDILSGVLGLKNDDVRKLGVNLEIDNNQPVPVLHAWSSPTTWLTASVLRIGTARRSMRSSVPQDSHKRVLLCLFGSSELSMLWATVDAATMPGEFSRSWAYEVAETARKREIASRL